MCSPRRAASSAIWFAWKKAVAHRTDDRPAKRMVSAAGWREDLMYALREEGNITAAPLLLPLANFYPRPPRGGRLGIGTRIVEVQVVSIHALREEGDFSERRPEMSRFRFLSTPSARRATFPLASPVQSSSYFYPRPPRGGRPAVLPPESRRTKFLSTPSARRATEETNTVVWMNGFLSTPSARRAT